MEKWLNIISKWVYIILGALMLYGGFSFLSLIKESDISDSPNGPNPFVFPIFLILLGIVTLGLVYYIHKKDKK